MVLKVAGRIQCSCLNVVGAVMFTKSANMIMISDIYVMQLIVSL